MVREHPARSSPAPAGAVRLGARDYRRLSDFRYLIRRFLEFSEKAAVQAGLTPRQHQALLAIKGAKEAAAPTVGYVAERLRIQHHSAVGLVDRLEQAGLLLRHHDAADRRRVRLELTGAAEHCLAELSAIHMQELERMRPGLLGILEQAGDGESSPAAARLNPEPAGDVPGLPGCAQPAHPAETASS